MCLQDIIRTNPSRDIGTADGPWSIGPGDTSLGLRHRTGYGLRLICLRYRCFHASHRGVMSEPEGTCDFFAMFCGRSFMIDVPLVGRLMPHYSDKGRIVIKDCLASFEGMKTACKGIIRR